MSNPTLRNHPKFLRLAAMLNISHALARGLLECLWDAVSHSGDPDIGNFMAIETAACWTGEPGQLCAALLECGCGRADSPLKPSALELKPCLTHYIPTFAEVQNFISESGLRGDAFDFINDYRQMAPKGPDQPDRWQFHLIKWARQKQTQWKRAARQRRSELIATCPR